MTTIGLLPQLAPLVAGQPMFVVTPNGDWRSIIQFNQPVPNQNLPLDISGIAFWFEVHDQDNGNTVLIAGSTDDGLLVNGGPSGQLAFAVPVSSNLGASYGMSRLPPGTSCLIDIIAAADGETINLCQVNGPGIVQVNRAVTRGRPPSP